ncbi:hypothetical protein HDU98_004341, partial [Podochytrium sp. JEL0797]
MRTAALVLAFAHAIQATALASGPNGCPAISPSGDLHIFGSPFGDLNLGSQISAWTSSSVPTQDINITALPNRPPFTSANLVCFPSFFLNSVLFMNADPNDPTTVHEYFYATQQWRKIGTNGLVPDMESVKAVMDFDTLVIYAFTDGGMVRLGDAGNNNLNFDTDMSVPFNLTWVSADNNAVPFDGKKYTNPTMAHAFFNIYFFGVPGTTNGEVWGYRIHYNEWGPVPQPVGSTFPSMH